MQAPSQPKSVLSLFFSMGGWFVLALWGIVILLSLAGHQSNRLAERFEAEGVETQAVIKSKPGVTGIGSIIFRDEESLITEAKDAGMDPWDFYRNNIYPFKGKVEEWYQQRQSFGTDLMILFLTAWVILFPKSNLHYKIFTDLPRRDLMAEIKVPSL